MAATMKRFPRIAAGVAGLLAAWAAASPGASAQDLLERARETGRVTVGYANEAPYGFTTPDGRLTGEAPEIARLILSRMGIDRIEGVVVGRDDLISGLKEGRFDIIAAGMLVAPEECAQILFSEPTYAVGEALVVGEGNPKGLATLDDVAASGDAILAVTAGAIEAEYARRSGIPAERILEVPDATAGAAAVEEGRADAFAAAGPTAGAAAAGADGLEVGDVFTRVAGEEVKGHGAFGFRKEDAAFARAFNQELAGFIGSEAHLALIQPFGFTEADLPEETTADLCEPVS